MPEMTIVNSRAIFDEWEVRHSPLLHPQGGIAHPKPEALHEYLTYKTTYPPRTLPWVYAQGPRGVLGGWTLSCGRGTPVTP